MPVGAVVVRVPPHTVEVLLATVSPVGNVSIKPTPVSVVELGLVSVNCNDDVVLSAMVVGLKAFAIVGGSGIVILAVTVALSTVASIWTCGCVPKPLLPAVNVAVAVPL